ncbi:LysR family transcriptional regulator [Ferrimonas senticii]|uniref:LysR family transcriptional regulator n=1 Tax=Ferrimonas senticii TaxID=394566 RepID=UPI0003FBB440|nr:LysR substrate-binding domain-containing protein [Ferrimonas senticii]
MKLPPLRATQCFEAVVRLNSFSLAAQALHITQSAVSHQVRQLEDYLGEPLLARQGRHWSLTPSGQRFYEQTAQALLQLANAASVFRDGSGGPIRLALYSSLAVKWLIPRLPLLKQQHPELQLSLNMVADNPQCSDQLGDCFITVKPPSSGMICQQLYQERLLPVCGQRTWQQLQQQPLPQALWSQPLLSVQSSFGAPQEDWRRWCQHNGWQLPSEVQFQHLSHMLLAAEAARFDQGIALVNHYMLDDLASHDLVRIPLPELLTGDSFYFVYKASRQRQPQLLLLLHWLQQQSLQYGSASTAVSAAAIG